MPISVERRRQAIAESISFADFVANSVNFTEEFARNYDAATLSTEDREHLASIELPLDVLAIVEDWCPDVVANLPILARIADDTSAIRLHVVVRGEGTRDVADAYPYEGRSHIPTYVFSLGSGPDLGVIVERPAPIRPFVAQFIDRFFDAHPELDRATFPAGLTEPLKAELTADSLQLRRDLRQLERESLVVEIAAFARRLATATSAH